MGNYTPEALEAAAAHLDGFAGSTLAKYAGMLRAYAANLRQQAGRVDEGMTLEEKCRVIQENRDYWYGVAEQYRQELYDAKAALTAALAQNTQGDAEGVAEIYDALPHCSERTTFTFSRDKLQALLRHAERARVPEGMVLVPREPTPEMIEAGNAEYEKALLGNRRNVSAAFNRKWAAMLAAAPSQRAEVK